MSRRTHLCLALWAATASLCWAGIPPAAFTISSRDRRDFLLASGVRLAVEAPPPQVDWEGRPAPGRWYVDGTRIKSTTGGGYLAYDPAAEDGRVFLAARPGPGTEWDVTVQERFRPAEGKRAVIRAAKGAMRGWYLAVQEVEEPRAGGRAVTTRRAFLAREPARKLEAERIYVHP